MKQRKRWFLKAELLILLCLVVVCVVKSNIVDISGVKAAVLKQQVVKMDPDNEAISAYKRAIDPDTDPDNKRAHHQPAKLRPSPLRSAVALTPESVLQQEIDSGRQQIQQQFTFQWNELNRQAKAGLFESPAKHEEALHKLYTRGKQEMFLFDQEAQQKINQLKQIDQLSANGLISNPKEAKWRIVLCPEAEAALFSKPAEPQ